MAKNPESLDGTPLPQRRPRRFLRLVRNVSRITLSLLVLLLVGVVLWPYVVVTVPSGSVGVLWRRLPGFDIYCVCFVSRGTALDPRQLRQEGLRFVWPWNELFIYDLRLQSSLQTYNAISKDGVSVTVQMIVRHQLQYRSLPLLHKFIGPVYLASVVAPEIGSQARNVVSQYTAQEVYTSREKIQETIRENSQRALDMRLNGLIQPPTMAGHDYTMYRDFLQGAVQIVDTLVLSIELPPAIIAAINRQTEQFYQIQEYRYRVQREAEESQRKQIEASGIATFQRTVSQGISESYLRWRGIEATLALAQSPNAKVVIIGGGKDGLPIILGNVDAPATSGGLAPPPNANMSQPSEKVDRGSATPPSHEAPLLKRMSGEGMAPATQAPATRSSGTVVPFTVESILSRLSGAFAPSQRPPEGK